MRHEEYIKLTIGNDTPMTRRECQLAFIGLAFLALLATCVVMLVTIGLRPDIGAAVMDAPAIGKVVFCLFLAAACTLMLYCAIQPEGKVVWYLLLVPFALLLAGAGVNMAMTDSSTWFGLIFDGRGKFCLLYINLLAIPAFIILTQAVRLFSPANLRRAGMLTGLAAGTIGAVAFGMRCMHDYPLWIAVFYMPAIAITGWVGRKIGPVLLRRW
ncbi:MAG: DUF1109 family protein [Alphaproteobacteria bacterium]|nr:DUF1109 family protein [Alphaproteobacteria bacterium]